MIENKTDEVQVPPMAPREFKVGDVVFANCVLVDSDPYGKWYIKARHGDLGVVLWCDQNHPHYDVNWIGGGQCTVHADEISIYQGGVIRINNRR